MPPRRQLPAPKNDVAPIKNSIIKRDSNSTEFIIDFIKPNSKERSEWVFILETSKMCKEWVTLLESYHKKVVETKS